MINTLLVFCVGLGGFILGTIYGVLSDKRSTEQIARLANAIDALTEAIEEDKDEEWV